MENKDPENRPVVLIINPEISIAGIDLLKLSCNLRICKYTTPRRDDILEKCQGVDAILWSGTNISIDAELLDAAGPQLKVISMLTFTIDHVDMNLLQQRNIQFGFTPEILKDTVAEFAIALLLAASRRFYEGRLAIDNSMWPKWHPLWLLGADIRGATCGFFGMNQFSIPIALRLRGFNVGKFIYTNKNYNARKKWLIPVNFEQLLKESHFLFINSPLIDKTKYLFNDEVFNKMSPTSVLINISNGQIIDQKALYNALKNKKIFAAGIDSCYPEPLPKNHPLLELPNLVITPNIRAQTKKSKEELAMLGAENILNALEGKDLWSSIHAKSGMEDDSKEFDF